MKTLNRYFGSFIAVLFILLLSSPTYAGNVTISGQVNKPRTLVRLMICDDLLNLHETSVAETYSDDNGLFVLEGKVGKTMPASIYVGLESVDFVVSPGASYVVSINVPEVDHNASYFDRELPTMRVATASDKGVYRQIIMSEQIINSYVLNYFDELYRRRQYCYLDSVKAAIDAEMDIKNAFVIQQNTYRIASVQMAVNADGGKKVIKDYYDGKPVLYNCPAYMDLFKDLFKTFELSDDFKQRNPKLAELITIYHLRGAYYNELPRLRGSIREKLIAVRKNSPYVETQQMVDNMLARFDKFASGSPAMDFELKDVDGNTVKLSDYKNVVVVLQFVDGSSRTVDHQFEVLSDLHRQWQNKVQLITVSTKDQLESHRKRFEEHHYDWPLLNLGNDILLLEQYEVRLFPEYFIINKGTKIGMAPAPSPDQTLDEYVRNICGN